jgi:hypothetical protein
MRLPILLLLALSLALPSCAGGGGEHRGSPRNYSSQRSSPPPSWTRMPSERTNCGPRRNFC